MVTVTERHRLMRSNVGVRHIRRVCKANDRDSAAAGQGQAADQKQA